MNPHNRDLLTLRSQKPVATHFPLLKLWTNCRGVTGSSFLHFILVRRYLWEWMGPCSIQGKVKVTLFIHSSGTDLFYFHFWALPCKGYRTCTFVWRLSFGECFSKSSRFGEKVRIYISYLSVLRFSKDFFFPKKISCYFFV